MSRHISAITGKQLVFYFGGDSYRDAAEMLSWAVRMHMGSYPAETAFEQATDEELAAEMMDSYDMQEGQNCHVWGPTDLTAAFAAYRAEVATWDRQVAA